MGYLTQHRVNEGVRIEIEGGSIDIIVRAIGGRKSYREADFEIRGIPGLEDLHLSWRDGIYHLMPGIDFGVRDNIRSASNTVQMHYRLDESLRVRKQVYDKVA